MKYKMSMLLLFTIILMSCSPAKYDRTLKGHIYDADNKEPIAGVIVEAGKAYSGTISDESGAYSITYEFTKSLGAHIDYWFDFTKAGYKAGFESYYDYEVPDVLDVYMERDISSDVWKVVE